MGSFFSIDIIRNWNGLDEAEGFSLIGGALNDKTIDYREADYKKPCIIIVGNEANGITDETLNLCTPVKIPIIGKAESLNVSIAAGILMYEVLRNR